ncbi:MAG: 3-deoxy-D-manno-octulosonic acid transferase [Sphingobacteriales bacterium JAD_PAG50586_3]|nr:MAG: 3-deoxy-D-manno-octulosonic acid transferase [Sphingobacteriales bacterium JAD_PAG50586_3]
MLYRLGTQLYILAIKLAAVFGNAKATLWVQGRKGLLEKIEAIDWGNREYIWVHCASLGEFEQGRPLIEKIKQENPQQKILLTFFSPSGYEVRKNYTGANYVFYLPADLQDNAARFVAAVKPKTALFVKYEFWEGYLSALQSTNTPTFLVSGIFRANQYFFKYKRLMPLRVFNYFFVQNQASKSILNAHGFANIDITGDTRFDRVSDVAQSLSKLAIVEEFANGNKLFIAGSTWYCDEIKIIELIKKAPQGWKFVIVPHEVGIAHFKKTEPMYRGVKVVHYSKGKEQDLAGAQVLIIDTVGTLSTAYRYAHISYVGGGFNNGIHNILEASVYGHPVLFGPKHQKFAEALELKKAHAAFSVNNAKELAGIFNLLNTDKSAYMVAATNSRRYVLENTGATNKIYNHLKAQGLV